jgi:hypothetical protein
LSFEHIFNERNGPNYLNDPNECNASTHVRIAASMLLTSLRSQRYYLEKLKKPDRRKKRDRPEKRKRPEQQEKQKYRITEA